MPGRRTRGVTVDYRVLDGADSDEDFNVSTPPVKRPRQKASERAAEFADGAGPSHGRLSRDDKLFKKQLRIALEKSKNDSQVASNSSSSDEHGVNSADTLPVCDEGVLESPKPETVQKDTSLQDSAGEAEWTAGGISSSDESDCSGDDSDYSDHEFKPQAKRATKKSWKENTTKTKPKARPPVGSTSAKSRRPAPVKSTTHQVSDTRSPSGRPQAQTTASPVTKSPAGGLPVGTTPPPGKPVLKVVNRTVSSPKSGPATGVTTGPITKSPVVGQTAATLRTPKWKPPARISEAGASNSRLSSPSSGGLRLGLSRNVRLKPLHPSAKQVT